MKPTHAPFEKPVIRPLPLPVWLAYLLVCTLLLTGVSFAHYITTANGGDTARVAAGLVTVNYEESDTEIRLERPTGNSVETKNFEFSVSNGSSEVAIRYDVVVTLGTSLEAGITMKLDGQTGSLTPNSDGSDGSVEYVFSNVGTFAAGENKTDTHTLSFEGDFGTIQKDTEETYNIEISVRSQQID